ncbi:MAG: pyridoxal-phosphate dependent enzyme [Bacteroidetes bacterium]|nr:pyridoxal-phosphate dependent enzyme [Bacteroidota bacterium]MCW5895329.1 pyridoxal-phosphate dependent enzyme [Bacteroidota bacterium]
MSSIIKQINHEVVHKTAKRCRERGITIPTFAQMRNPALIPQSVTKQLAGIGLWDLNPLNLFRITWKNDVKTGLFGGVNYLEIPQCITGVKARIVGLVGKYFPTGAHKVGAAFGCLVPRLVSGEFDPTRHKAVWPSTGNFCRGGAFDCALLDCTAVAILPEEMSKERFAWLKEIGAEVIATPGCESNVKEIYDKCWELKRDPINVIFNQFEEFGNPIWHYTVTGPAIEEVFDGLREEKKQPAAFISATGSAGTIAAGDYLKKQFPSLKIVASEALQCPTLLMNGFGGHRIEGIGDKHVPWVHNVRNTDAVAAIDDNDCMRVLRLFNEPAGREYLSFCAVNKHVIDNLPLLGISSIGNLLAAIKTAKYFELGENDVVFTIFTDSMDLYKSRVEELREEQGDYTVVQAAKDHAAVLEHQGIDYFKELTYYDRKALHNLKYFTWVEQQGRTVEELNALWEPEFWQKMFEEEVVVFDRMIEEFNAKVGIM